MSKDKTGTQEQRNEVQFEDRREITIRVNVNINKTRKIVGYCLIVWDQSGKLIYILAAAEERKAEQEMEEASAIKLALKLAKTKGWNEVTVLTNNRSIIQKLMVDVLVKFQIDMHLV